MLPFTNRSHLVAVMAAAMLFAAACSSDDDGASGGDASLEVVASTTILADWVEQVGGDDVDVTSIVPQETDVHGYVLTPGDIQDIAAADLVVMVGAGLESAFEGEVEENAAGTVLHLADGLDLQPLPAGFAMNEEDESDDHEDEADDGEHDHGAGDPHIWMDIDLAIASVEQIGIALASLDPDNVAAYERRASEYTATLGDLDHDIGGMLANLPENERYLVTFHDAFGYFAARYGFELLGFIVESPEEQPSASAYARLVDAIVERDVAYIYTEPQFDARVVEQLADETGAGVRVLPSGALTPDYPDYVTFMRTIAERIVE